MTEGEGARWLSLLFDLTFSSFLYINSIWIRSILLTAVPFCIDFSLQ